MTTPVLTEDGKRPAETLVEADHEFKAHPTVFHPARRGDKTFEFRKDDRGGYQVGQTVCLRCYAPETGYADDAPLYRVITDILRPGEFGLQAGYCILSLRPLSTAPAARPRDGVERVRHVKRGTEYEVLGEAEAQVSTGFTDNWGTGRTLRDGADLTVYRDPKSGKLWCRFPDEMRDGRFVPAAAPAADGGRA